MKKNIENFKIQEIPQSKLSYLWGGAGPGTPTAAGTQVIGKGTPEETSFTYESDCVDADGRYPYKCKWSDGVYHDYGNGMTAGGSTGLATQTSTTIAGGAVLGV